MIQTTLTGQKIYSCCHCSWEGINPKESTPEVAGTHHTIHSCPKCNWCAWELADAIDCGQNSNIYPAFIKKYGGRKQ